MSENMLFEELQNQWNLLVSKVEHLEQQVQQLSAQPAPQAPAPGAPVAAPPGWPAGGLGTPPAPQAPAPQAPGPQAPAPQAPGPQAPGPQAPGPQGVPSFQQLQERMLQLSQAKGDKACIDLIAAYGGKDQQGTVKISLIPKERYAALFADIGSQLGLH